MTLNLFLKEFDEPVTELGENVIFKEKQKWSFEISHERENWQDLEDKFVHYEFTADHIIDILKIIRLKLIQYKIEVTSLQIIQLINNQKIDIETGVKHD